MQVVLALHVISMVAWFAGLFYLPRLFVYHVEALDEISRERFKVMERRLCYGIMTPAAILTAVFGFWEMSYKWGWYETQMWMHLKLILVLVLCFFHLACMRFVYNFKHNRNHHSSKFYRFFNEAPTVLLIAIVFLVVLKRPV
ncbi:MAG: TIGR00701 family protein [Coxiella sp. (in: Bacteria)]|nr:MAG: TIGR00701 family protein [Coxiella sp. (in: g-proteobacteria)]